MSIGEILILPDLKPSVKSVMLIEVTAAPAPCLQMAPDEDFKLIWCYFINKSLKPAFKTD